MDHAHLKSLPVCVVGLVVGPDPPRRASMNEALPGWGVCVPCWVKLNNSPWLAM